MNDNTIRELLTQTHTWAVVGLGNNPSRDAYRIASFLQQQGKRIIPVHPAAEPVLGETGYAHLADIPDPVDVVDVFRRSSAAGQFADEAITIGAKAVWFQLGVIDEAAAERVRTAGLAMVMDHCPKIEWGRLRLGS